jgi:cobalt-precorrin-6B (C15)-methyltransferase
MRRTKLSGGPTQEEIMAISLQKLGLRTTDIVLEIGCGTGKVTTALAGIAKKVFSIDRRPEAVSTARDSADQAGVSNVDFFCTEAVDFLSTDRVYDCVFIGGTKQIAEVLPVVSKKVRRTIVVNAVLVNTLSETVAAMQELGIFCEVVQVQVSRSHSIAGSFMFRPIDPVYIIVGRGTVC